MSEAVEQCKIAMQALSDWAVTYAPDMCDAETVAKAKQRIHQHGTLAYIANATDQLQSVITALSEAEQRERREALEEAAKVTDARAKEYEDEARDLRGSEQDRRFCASVAFRLRGTASAIRALIPSEPHDAEGRN